MKSNQIYAKIFSLTAYPDRAIRFPYSGPGTIVFRNPYKDDTIFYIGNSRGKYARVRENNGFELRPGDTFQVAIRNRQIIGIASNKKEGADISCITWEWPLESDLFLAHE